VYKADDMVVVTEHEIFDDEDEGADEPVRERFDLEDLHRVTVSTLESLRGRRVG
jgi:hypothetical protein